MIGGPYREGEGETRAAKLTRVVYSISPWAALMILVMQATILGVAATIIRGPERVVKVVAATCPRSHPRSETPEQRALTHQQDVALCSRECTMYVAVKWCQWHAGGVRECGCECQSPFGWTSTVEEQR